MKICKSTVKKTLTSLLFLLFLTACGTPAPGLNQSVFYTISGATHVSAFRLERLELGFTEGGTNPTVALGQSVQPFARIRFSGQGVLRASWLLDGRVFEQVNLTLQHGSLLTLSPRQPVSTSALASGIHRIRLKVESPQVAFRLPEITFFITPG